MKYLILLLALSGCTSMREMQVGQVDGSALQNFYSSESQAPKPTAFESNSQRCTAVQDGKDWYGNPITKINCQ